MAGVSSCFEHEHIRMIIAKMTLNFILQRYKRKRQTTNDKKKSATRVADFQNNP